MWTPLWNESLLMALHLKRRHIILQPFDVVVKGLALLLCLLFDFFHFADVLMQLTILYPLIRQHHRFSLGYDMILKCSQR